MKQPLGFEILNGKFCKHKRSIYGLKQSARCWNEKLIDVLLKAGFKKGLTDGCILRIQKNGEVIFVLIYVDDILVATKSSTNHWYVASLLKNNFQVTDLGKVNYYLGIKIEKRDDGYFTISQEQYILQIIEDDAVENAKISNIPMDVGYIRVDDISESLPNNQNYRHLIGRLLYLAINLRPDITTTVSILSRKVSNPTFRDWVELKRLIRYLNGTMTLKLNLKVENKNGLYGFADADWAQNRSDRKSNSGFFFKYNGSPILWCCIKQDSVSLSSTEAEYILQFNLSILT